MKKVYFVRHGQAEGNETIVFKRPDALLTQQGVEESYVLAQKIKLLKPALLITGPLSRTIQTAEIIQAEVGIPMTVEDFFSGVQHASSMSGKSKDGIEAQLYLQTIKRIYSDDPNARYEDGENYSEFHKRLCGGLDSLEQRQETSVVVVTHESVIKSLLILVLHNKEYNPAFNIDLKKHIGNMTNIGITTFEFTDTWKLISWNEN